MSDLLAETRVLVARLRHLVIDVARRGALASPLSEIPHTELDPRELEALWWLRAEGPLVVNTLAERLGVAMPPTVRLLDRLQERGLVVRERGIKGDRRRVRVRLTESGAALAEHADTVVQERLARLLGPMAGEDRSALMDLLERWVEALGSAASTPDEDEEDAPPHDALPGAT
jgi:DNA-binding MarR family transcriptional regulator